METVRETSTPVEIFATSAEFDYDQTGAVLLKNNQPIGVPSDIVSIIVGK